MTTNNPIAAGRSSPFEQIKHTDGADEYWSARELGRVLGYGSWQKFAAVVAKAQTACENSGFAPSDHFIRADEMITVGKGGHRKIEDYQLSRYACYLIVQNADPSKRIVALGQAYFAIQTRRQELADRLAGKTEAEQRIILRDQIAERNGHLAEAASAAGVVTQRDFARNLSRSWLSRALYRDSPADRGAQRAQARRAYPRLHGS